MPILFSANTTVIGSGQTNQSTDETAPGSLPRPYSKISVMLYIKLLYFFKWFCRTLQLAVKTVSKPIGKTVYLSLSVSLCRSKLVPNSAPQHGRLLISSCRTRQLETKPCRNPSSTDQNGPRNSNKYTVSVSSTGLDQITKSFSSIILVSQFSRFWLVW
jgi:hypothetical protein